MVQIAVIGVQVDAHLIAGDEPGAAEGRQLRRQQSLQPAELGQQEADKHGHGEQPQQVIDRQAQGQSTLGKGLAPQIEQLDQQAAEAIVVMAQGQLNMQGHIRKDHPGAGAQEHLPPFIAEKHRQHQAERGQGQTDPLFIFEPVHRHLLSFIRNSPIIAYKQTNHKRRV